MNTIRQLIDSRAANQIGPSGCWLLAVLSVSGRTEWWDDELAGVSGIGSRSTLCRVRDACVLAGWLRYEPGAKGRPAVYTILSKFDAESGQNVTQNTGRIRAECDAESEQKPQRKKRQQVTASVDDPPIPHEFDTREFRAAWNSWILYRCEKKKPVSKRAAAQQFSTLLGWWTAGFRIGDLIASIEQSIANDWQGLFEPRGNGGRQVVDRTALANFMRSEGGASGICEGDGIFAGGSSGDGTGGNSPFLLAPPAGSGQRYVAGGGAGDGCEPRVPHTPASGGNSQGRTARTKRRRADMGRGLFDRVSSSATGGGQLRDNGGQAGSVGTDAGAAGGTGWPDVVDDLPF